MSRIRIGHKPGDWRIEAPAVGRIHHTRSALPGAITVAPLGRPKGFTDVPVATPPSDDSWTGSRAGK